MKKIFTFLAIILSSASLSSQEQNLQFNTDGLYNAELFDNIFRGHFENVDINREDLEFVNIFNQYLRAYGRQCDNFLPDDKVPIMNIVCAEEETWVTKNGYGVEISRTTNCVRWEKKKSDLYARPDLYAAYEEVERIHDIHALREALELMADQNALGNSVDMAHKAKALLFDMARIFELNSCDSPELERFEENLKLFALNQSSIRMQGVSKYTAMKKSGGPAGEQDFKSLIDHLVADQSKTWMFNRYVRGSISGVTFLGEDSQGRPTEIKANYQYSGFTGNNKGWVKITFSNGLPNGIYFFDFPNNRKTPGSSIVASYAQGNYGK
jgi:hypothetical protein